MNKVIFLFITLLSLANVAFGKITLPSTIGDNMVLQKQSQVIIWGNSNQNVKINLISSWNEKSYQTFANSSGKWSLELTTPIAGEPYEIRLSDGNELILHNILICEVWVCSGQSNMEMALCGNSSPVLNSNEIILNADNPSLRLFGVDKATSLNRQTLMQTKELLTTSMKSGNP